MTPYSNRRTVSACAFTLIELLAVIAIVGILAALIIATVSRAKKTARTAQCVSNLRSIGGAVLLYTIDNKGWTPALTYTFIQDLWGYTHPEAPVQFSGNELPSQLAGTVFECPVANEDTAPFVTTKRSYGLNAALDPTAPTSEKQIKGVQLSRITQPSQAALIGDVRNSSMLVVGTLNPRHDGKINICFVDGHAAAVAITPAMQAADAQANNVFWNGVGK